MKYIYPFLYLIAGVILIGGCQPEEKNWWKGNLHTHSYWSDGDDYPEQIVSWYEQHDYDFVAISDHNVLAEGEEWIEFAEGSERDTVFQNYLENFGEGWVEYEQDDDTIKVRLKMLEEYRELFEEPGSFLIIKSEEITDGYEDKPIHINATNIQELIEPQGGNSVVEVMQNNIDAIHEQREETGEPILPHLNHPNFGWAVTAEDLKELEGERFFEVYNGHPLVHNEGDSVRSSTEQMWDEVNTYYLLEDRPLLYGIAVDDAHHYHTMSDEHANPGRGWIQVRSDSLTTDSLIAAIERGDFYGSNGVELRDVRFAENRLEIAVKEEESVEYEIQFIGTMTEEPSETGVLLDSQKGAEASYEMSGEELFVRAKVISDKKKENPYKEGEKEVAWVQPVVPE